MQKTKSPFELLRNRSILSILDGDNTFGTIDGVDISMPYLSGPEIVGISQLFGLDATYKWGGGGPSRWVYLDNIVEHCILNNRVNELLAYLFSKKQFEEKLYGEIPDKIEKIYAHIIDTIIKQINSILYFGGNKLVVNNKTFSIIPLDNAVEIETPTIRNIDRQYIRDISDRAMQDIVDNNYDSAITKARTLLEEIFCYVIEKKNEEPPLNGNIRTMYKQTRELYNMHTDRNNDRRINTLLSGLEKIVSSIAEMRNTNSDAHGVGSRRLNIAEHHARLFVNSSITMAEFIVSVGDNN